VREEGSPYRNAISPSDGKYYGKFDHDFLVSFFPQRFGFLCSFEACFWELGHVWGLVDDQREDWQDC
jgi:hypothetical protein